MFTPQNKLLCAAILLAPHFSDAIAKNQAYRDLSGETLDFLTDLALDVTDRLTTKISLKLDNLPVTIPPNPNLTVQGWIPASGRLPEEREIVLCATKNQWTGHELLLGYRIGLRWVSLDSNFPMPDVTHWLSIPPVPK